MHSEDDKKMFSEMDKLSIYARGAVLHLVIKLEKAIDIYLTEHFADDKKLQEEIMCLIISPQVNLSPKKDIFLYLLEKYNPEFLKTNPNMPSILKKIAEERNIYAHRPVSFNPDAVELFRKERSLIFLKLRETKIDKVSTLVSGEKYTEKKINTFIELIRLSLIEIDKLLKHDAPL